MQLLFILLHGMLSKLFLIGLFVYCTHSQLLGTNYVASKPHVHIRVVTRLRLDFRLSLDRSSELIASPSGTRPSNITLKLEQLVTIQLVSTALCYRIQL